VTPQQIKAARKQLGLNQAEFAQIMGLGYDYITKIETGRSTLGATASILLRAYLDGYRNQEWRDIRPDSAGQDVGFYSP